MSTEDMKYVATALGRMQTTGKTTLEYLNPLLERGVDVWSYLSEASGKTKKEVQQMVSDGLVPGEEAAKAIADYMGVDFAGNMEKQSQTYSGLISTLADGQAALDNAMGAGYNSTRKSGLQDQIDWLSGESGQGMQDAYNKIGQWKASLANLAEQYQRDAINSVMNGTIEASFENSSQKKALESLAKEYADAQKEYNSKLELGDKEGAQTAGAEMGRIIAEAQAIATNEYNSSEGAQLALETNKTLAENIKNDSAGQDAYWNAGYTMGQQFTKGLASSMLGKSALSNSTTKDQSSITYSDIFSETDPSKRAEMYLSSPMGRNHAVGLNYVPYNNYPAYLHEGERVLTASENRNYGKSNPVNITGNNFIIRKESDIEAIAQKLADMLNSAYLLAPQ
jgi:tape measure domain-containing protein